MFRRIIVGWNGTPQSETALSWALERGTSEPITLVHAIGGSPTASEYLSAGGELSEQRATLMDRADRLRTESPGYDITTRTVHGSPTEALSEYLEPGTLVVVGTPKRRAGSRWSAGARLAGRHTGGTVAVIPSIPTDDRRASVVAGVDGSVASLAAVDLAAEEANRLGLSLVLVHAWEVPRSWSPLVGEYATDVEAYRRMHRDVLDDALEYARTVSSSEPYGRLESGAVSEVLADSGRSAALVTVASHSSGAVTRFLLGSVSFDLVLEPPAPVLVVTPKVDGRKGRVAD